MRHATRRRTRRSPTRCCARRTSMRPGCCWCARWSTALGVDFASVALISEDGRRATGLVGLLDGVEADWWPDVEIDLDQEPSAIATAAFEAAPIFVYDVAASARVSRRLADRVGAESAVFIPLISSGRVHAVLVGATTKERRLFANEEIAALESLAGEAALAVERAQSSSALADALERERIVGEIARKVRSELDLDDVLRVAVEETAGATGASRAFIRLGEAGEPMPVLAEWDAPGTAPVGGAAPEPAGAQPGAARAANRGNRGHRGRSRARRPDARQPRQPACARRPREPRDADPRLRSRDRGLRTAPPRSAPVVGAGADVARERRERGRAGDPHGPAAGGERAAARAVVGAAEGIAVRDQRAAPRDRPPAAGGRGDPASSRRRRRLLPVRRPSQRPHVRRGARARPGRRLALVLGRPRARGRGPPAGPRPALRRLRGDHRAGPASRLQQLPQRDRGADDVVGREARRARRRQPRRVTTLRPGRRQRARDLRRPGLDRASPRRRASSRARARPESSAASTASPRPSPSRSRWTRRSLRSRRRPPRRSAAASLRS